MRISDWSSDVCSSDLLLDAFAELEADIVFQRDRRAGFLRRLGDDIGDRGLVVHHEKLAEQGLLLGELGDRAVHHLGDDLGGLPRFGGLFGGDAALALPQGDPKSTRLHHSLMRISDAGLCVKRTSTATPYEKPHNSPYTPER